MPKREPRTGRAVPDRESPEPAANLRAALGRRKKAELVEVLVELAREDRKILRLLHARFEVAADLGERVAATRAAIADATAFDPRDINRNFDYDEKAYAEVKRNLALLIGAGHLPTAMTLALELMKHGSRQVEMSDEGVMTPEIEGCVELVVSALGRSNLPAAEVAAWCSAMLERDRMRFIATDSLRALRDRFQTDASG